MRTDAFEGCLLGLAIGDALGYPAEFRRRAQLLETWGENGLTDFVRILDPRWPAKPMILGMDHPPGTYTDDTQMTIAVARGLLEEPAADLDRLMQQIGGHFVAWSRSEDNNRAPGNACMTGCEKLARGVPWRQAGVPDSKGCGSAMRVAAIGLVYRDDRARLLEVARASSLLTHGHDAAVEGAAAAALLVALALERTSPDAMYEQVMRECAAGSKDFARCMKKLPGLLDEDPALVLSKRGLGEAWVAEEAVASALYCFWRSPGNFHDTVLTGANTDGDSDSIACIAGSISGAFNGARGIPQTWRERVENSSGLCDLAVQLQSAG